MTVKIAIIQFPGSNCEREAIMAVKRVGMEAEEFLWNQSIDKLSHYDGYLIVGGFSYEDRSRAGIIAALDPIMLVLKQQAELGKPVLGICNGAQILVETGLVPGVTDNQVCMAIAQNKRIDDKGQVLGTGYYNCWTPLKRSLRAKRNAFNRFIGGDELITAPIAHAEGRFLMPDGLLTKLMENGQIAWQYCNAKGEIEDSFPVNPNGTLANIAAITNPAGNIMAIMPHPERTANCDAIFASMRDYILEGNYSQLEPLDWQISEEKIQSYQPSPQASVYVIDTIITDNHSASVQQALKLRGIDVKISRRVHFEVESDHIEQIESILLSSGELFNPNKERVVNDLQDRPPNSYALLVRERDNILGKKCHQMLAHHFGVQTIKQIKQGVLWYIEAFDDSQQTVQTVLKTNILYNQYAHECYTL